MRELDRFKVVQAVADQGLAIWRAAERLGLSRRQVERRVCAGVHGGLQCALCQVAEERLRCPPAAAWRRGPGAHLLLARMAQGVGEPDPAVRQGDVFVGRPAGAPQAGAPLPRGGRVPGWHDRAVGRRRFPALHHL
ncbi:helix-turn-helix domain-containing protein [Ralstonia sp. Ralssp110]|uniref:helix-turn-helix domain-containing protein n=1 Tax=Ralstonia sp. Ralssp110 TaxID=3243004 RepID=UPI0039B5A71A